MNLLIAGSRTFQDYGILEKHMTECDAIFHWDQYDTVLSGAARGADLLGERWAEANGKLIKRFPALWELYGKKAGMIRNAQMIHEAQAVVVFWDGVSSGAKHTLQLAQKHRLPYSMYNLSVQRTLS